MQSIIEAACQISIVRSNPFSSGWSARHNKSIPNKRPSAHLSSAGRWYTNEQSRSNNDSSSFSPTGWSLHSLSRREQLERRKKGRYLSSQIEFGERCYRGEPEVVIVEKKEMAGAKYDVCKHIHSTKLRDINASERIRGERIVEKEERGHVFDRRIRARGSRWEKTRGSIIFPFERRLKSVCSEWGDSETKNQGNISERQKAQ